MAHVQKNLPRIMAALTSPVRSWCPAYSSSREPPRPPHSPHRLKSRQHPSASPLPPATPADTPRPEGLEVVTLDGRHAVRGANIYQRRVFPEMDGTEFYGPGPFGPPYTQADLDRLSDLGANYVNISTAGLFTVQPPYELDEEALASLDGLLEMVAAADMFAVITFRTGPGRSEFAIIGDEQWPEPESTSSTRSGRISPPATPGRRCGSSRRSAIAKIPSSSAMT